MTKAKTEPKTEVYLRWGKYKDKRWVRCSAKAEGAIAQLVVHNKALRTTVTHNLDSSEAARLVQELEKAFDLDKPTKDGSGTPRQVAMGAQSICEAEDERILVELAEDSIGAHQCFRRQYDV